MDLSEGHLPALRLRSDSVFLWITCLILFGQGGFMGYLFSEQRYLRAGKKVSSET